MKNIYPLILLCISVLCLSSCDDKLDIVPKGETTLTTVDDLETLLNQVYNLDESPGDLETLTNTCYASVSADLKGTYEYILASYDESVKREALRLTDVRYNTIYNYILNTNIVIAKTPEAKGDSKQKKRIVAEARVVRGWLHFLIANIHAKQYDNESQAAGEGGIAYVDNINFQEQKKKISLKETYDRILEDCSDEVIEKLYDNPTKVHQRVAKDFGYGMRALVLLQMKDYDRALIYANKALAINSVIEDRTETVSGGDWKLSWDHPSNYFFVYSRGPNTSIGYTMISKETVELFEEGDILMENYIWDPDYAEEYNGAYFNTSSANISNYGIRTEQIVYAAAECLIRQGKYDQGLKMVDRVREKRIYDYCYEPIINKALNPVDETEAMRLLERAKRVEMIYTVQNFLDLRRWNTEEKYKRTIVRDLGEGESVSLRPDSPLWVFPFPLDAVNRNSSLTQNY